MSEEEELFSVEEVTTGETQIVTVEEVRTTSEPQVVTTQERKEKAELKEVHISTHASEKPSEKKPLEVEETVHKSHEDEISPELEELLHTDPSKGLNQQEVAERLAKFGRNELAEVKRNALLHFLSFCTYQTELPCYLWLVLSIHSADFQKFPTSYRCHCLPNRDCLDFVGRHSGLDQLWYHRWSFAHQRFDWLRRRSEGRVGFGRP